MPLSAARRLWLAVPFVVRPVAGAAVCSMFTINKLTKAGADVNGRPGIAVLANPIVLPTMASIVTILK
jgi:hypothetical protein